MTLLLRSFPLLASLAAGAAVALGEGVVREEFVFEEAPFAECHASTLVSLLPERHGASLLAAWFGGTEEGHPDVGIWSSRYAGDGWSPPREVATGTQLDGTRHPTWNPVLFRPTVRGGRGSDQVLLFYKVGRSPRDWWGMLKRSDDGGETWSEAEHLPARILGPIKNKPLELRPGVLLAGSSTEHRGWRVHFELFDLNGLSLSRIGPVASRSAPPGPFGAIQPTLLRYADGRIQALCRSQQGRIVQTWSSDGGDTWSDLEATELPNPSAGIDGVTLEDKRQLLVYNHKVRDGGRWEGSRSRLNVALSNDGEEWSAAVELENQPGEYSYPAVIQTPDGKVHVTYTWRRQRIKHTVLDPARFELRPIQGGVWPSGEQP